MARCLRRVIEKAAGLVLGGFFAMGYRHTLVAHG
jgi:hypothetical protein